MMFTPIRQSVTVLRQTASSASLFQLLAPFFFPTQCVYLIFRRFLFLSSLSADSSADPTAFQFFFPPLRYPSASVKSPSLSAEPPPVSQRSPPSLLLSPALCLLLAFGIFSP